MAIEFDNNLTPSESDFLQVLRGTTDVDGKLESASSAGLYPVSDLINKIVADIGSDYLAQSDIYNGLDSDDTTKALGAEQGKALKDAIDSNGESISSEITRATNAENVNATNISNNADNIDINASNIDTNTTAITKKINTSDIYDGLDSTNTDVPLSAKNGKDLDERVTTVEGRQNVVLENLIAKGDFSDMSDWSFLTGVEYTVTDGVLEVTNLGDVTYGYKVFQQITDVPDIGDIIYISEYMKTSYTSYVAMSYNDGDGLNVATYSSSGEYEHLSINITITNDSRKEFRAIYANLSGDISTTPIYVKQAMTLNLTDIFGTGYEPSKELMDKAIDIVGYFEDTHTMTNKELAIAHSEYCKDLATAITELGGTI